MKTDFVAKFYRKILIELKDAKNKKETDPAVINKKFCVKFEVKLQIFHVQQINNKIFVSCEQNVLDQVKNILVPLPKQKFKGKSFSSDTHFTIFSQCC